MVITESQPSSTPLDALLLLATILPDAFLLPVIDIVQEKSSSTVVSIFIPTGNNVILFASIYPIVMQIAIMVVIIVALVVNEIFIGFSTVLEMASTIALKREVLYSQTVEVDYRIPDSNRHLEVRVANQSLFVDPKHIQDVSPQVSAFLLREFTHHGRTSIEPQLEDLCFEEILEAVKTLCPTELGMFPSPVTAHTFSVLARLSKHFEVPKLRSACELFVARLPFLFKEVTALQLAHMLDISCQYSLNLRSKLRLLQGVLIIMVAEEQDKTHFATYYEKSVDPIIADLIKEAVASFKRGELSHDEFLDEARLKVPCRLCRTEDPGDQYSSNLKVCRRCRHTICFHCQISPCSSSLTIFLEKFGKTTASRLKFF
ncbi:unnamed protein product [Bursaphelenchus xylophilus]|uniref:(pine wood nematode) hypothetical protein n=1 Tax=Bursaphelenchus xylophilus TaxID=6326 RepID=A0A1I7RRE3_BURXY|nr:unnamed protein product [Bursaphelenchus xylophilus]CAG9130975.1 unnamed protein product [Bursaphelenchus xylophilus]